MKRKAIFCIMLLCISFEMTSQTLYKSIEIKPVTSPVTLIDTLKLSKVVRLDARRRMTKFRSWYSNSPTNCYKDIKGNFFLRYEPFAEFVYNSSGMWLQSLHYILDNVIESKVLEIVKKQEYMPVDDPGIPNLREMSNNAGSWYEINANKEGELDEYDLPKTFVMVISKKYQLIRITEVKEDE